MTLETETLATVRLSLRALRADDANALFAMRADVEATRYWSSPPWTEIAQAEAHLSDACAPAAGTFLRQFGIERRAG